MTETERMDRATDQLDTLIERRATTKEKANAAEEGWKATARAYNDEHEESRGHAWRTYWKRLAANHREIALDLERRAERLGTTR